MNIKNEYSLKKAQSQWNDLLEIYKKIIPQLIIEIPPVPQLTELCYIGDSLFSFKGKTIFSRFAVKERAQETEYVIKYFNSLGIFGERVPDDVCFEGSGETMVWNNKILVGYG